MNKYIKNKSEKNIKSKKLKTNIKKIKYKDKDKRSVCTQVFEIADKESLRQRIKMSQLLDQIKIIFKKYIFWE